MTTTVGVQQATAQSAQHEEIAERLRTVLDNLRARVQRREEVESERSASLSASLDSASLSQVTEASLRLARRLYTELDVCLTALISGQATAPQCMDRINVLRGVVKKATARRDRPGESADAILALLFVHESCRELARIISSYSIETFAISKGLVPAADQMRSAI